MIEENNNNYTDIKKKSNYTAYDDEKKKEKRNSVFAPWILFIPSVIALLCYLNAFDGDFVHDDIFAIKNNPDVAGKSSVSELFFNDFWGKPMSDNTSHKSYRPLTVLTFRWNHYLTGTDPFYFHGVNVLLHVCVTFLFVYTCKHAFRLPRACSLVAGLMFAVHPIHTEAVSGIVGRADLLAALFFLISFLAYTRSLDAKLQDFPAVKTPGLFCCSLVSSCIAMMCKETGITALGVCLLYDIGVACRVGVLGLLHFDKHRLMACRPLLTRVFIILVFTACLLSFRLWIMDGTLPTFLYQDNPASFQSSIQIRMMTYGYIWIYNIWLLLAPSNLCYDWQNGSIPLVKSITDIRNVATLATAIVFVTFLYKSNVKDRVCIQSPDRVLMCLVFTVVPFLPASNMFFRVGFVLAERILYIPSLGFCLCVAVGFDRLSTKYRHMIPAFVALLSLLLLLHAGKTWRQNRVWHSRESLFRSGIEALPHNPKVHYNYANLLKDSGMPDMAVHHYRETLRLDISYASAHNNLGTLIHDDFEAEQHFREALRFSPLHQGAHINMGNRLFKRGERAEGIRYLYKAVTIDYTNTDALTSMGWSLMEIGNLTEAHNYITMALELAPQNYEVNLHYGAVLEQMGRHKESATYYQKAYELDSSKSATLVHAAHAYNKMGDTVQAEGLLKRAMQINRDPNTLEQLAVLYYHSGRRSESLSLYEEIRKMSSNSTETLLRYVKVLGNTGNLKKAEELLLQILQHDAYNVEVLHTMGQVSGAMGKHEQAIEYISRAIQLGKHGSGVDLVKLYFDRGNNYKDLKRFEEALQDFDTTLKLSPTHDGAHGNAGTIYHMNAVMQTPLGNIKKARYHYNEALKLNPANDIVIVNLQKLDRLQIQRDKGIG